MPQVMKLFCVLFFVFFIIDTSHRVDAFSIGLGGQFYKREDGKVSLSQAISMHFFMLAFPIQKREESR